MSTKPKNSTQDQIKKSMSSGGIIYIENVRVYIDCPTNYSVVESPTGFWIRNAMGWNTYFKCPTREKAQMACNSLYGKSAYTVNSKI